MEFSAEVEVVLLKLSLVTVDTPYMGYQCINSLFKCVTVVTPSTG